MRRISKQIISGIMTLALLVALVGVMPKSVKAGTPYLYLYSEAGKSVSTAYIYAQSDNQYEDDSLDDGATDDTDGGIFTDYIEENLDLYGSAGTLYFGKENLGTFLAENSEYSYKITVPSRGNAANIDLSGCSISDDGQLYIRFNKLDKKSTVTVSIYKDGSSKAVRTKNITVNILAPASYVEEQTQMIVDSELDYVSSVNVAKAKQRVKIYALDKIYSSFSKLVYAQNWAAKLSNSVKKVTYSWSVDDTSVAKVYSKNQCYLNLQVLKSGDVNVTYKLSFVYYDGSVVNVTKTIPVTCTIG